MITPASNFADSNGDPENPPLSVITTEPKDNGGGRLSSGSKSSKNPFFLSKTSNAIAIRIKELDECCCANVPCISIVKEYCESRYS